MDTGTLAALGHVLAGSIGITALAAAGGSLVIVGNVVGVALCELNEERRAPSFV